MLGRTGIEVSRVGLGGLFVSSFGGEFEQARGAVRRAVERGVRYIDTAPGYHDSEAVLGRILADIAEPLILSTKLGGRPQPFDPKDPAGLRASVEESLRLLGRDRIDVLLIHEPDRPRQYDWWTSGLYAERPDGPVLEVLDGLRREGLVRSVGLGGTTAYEMARLCDTGLFDVVLTAFNYSLLWREAGHSVLPAAKRHNMGVVVGSPLHQGALARRFDREVASGAPWLSPPRREQYRRLYALLDETGLPIAEVALRFVLSHPDIDCVLTGARSAAEVDANLDAAQKGALPPDLLARLDEIAALVPFRPCGEPFFPPFGRDTYVGPPAAG
jgi:aryl-alcohol dehydrogenase-like predicted oxidoreductase